MFLPKPVGTARRCGAPCCWPSDYISALANQEDYWQRIIDWWYTAFKPPSERFSRAGERPNWADMRTPEGSPGSAVPAIAS